MWKAYHSASKAKKKKLKYIYDQPKMVWRGAWTTDKDIYKKTKACIEVSQKGDPNAVGQLAVFRLEPWYTKARTGKPTKAQRKSYKRWVKNQTRAIGDTPTIIVLQPDMAFLMTAKLRGNLNRYNSGKMTMNLTGYLLEAVRSTFPQRPV